jgi:2-amino-4-hydroxy-6-hydroxymethyldihydropteridine diphosphokinase
MTKVYLGIGSNLDQPLQQVQQAIALLKQIPQTTLLQHSSFYTTKPVGFHDQPDFINAVALLETKLTAAELLLEMQTIELRQGRIRNAEKNGPRILDLDLLLFADEIIQEENLTVPHPRMKERVFVLQPLAEISPHLCLPTGEIVIDLLRHLSK